VSETTSVVDSISAP